MTRQEWDKEVVATVKQFAYLNSASPDWKLKSMAAKIEGLEQELQNMETQDDTIIRATEVLVHQ